MLETRLLYYFLAVAREQNITKAAEVLHIAQPSLSNQMKELEAKLGKQLLVRGKKKTVLTEDGMLLRSKAEEIVSLLEKCESSFSEENSISGDICIGCAESRHMGAVTAILKRIQEEYPHVKCRYISGMADDIFEKLDSGVVEAAIMIDPLHYEKFSYRKLPFEETSGLLIRRDHPLAKKEAVTLDDLTGVSLIMSDQNIGSNELLSWYKGRELNIVARYNLIYNAAFMVEQGMGCAYCLKGLVNTEGRNFVFRPFFPEMKSGLYVVTKKYRNLSSSVELFLKLLEG